VSTYLFDDYELDVARYELRRLGVSVPVEPQVFEVLAFLVQHADRVVSKDDLFSAVWPEGYVTESALTSRIKAARQAVGDDGQRQRVIRTVHGRGYRFVGELRAPASSATEPTAALVPADPAVDAPPPIRYAQSADGARIAYWTRGDGPDLVALPDLPFADCEADWRLAPLRAFLQRVGAGARLIRYDARDTGQSAREGGDLSLDSHVADLLAVLDAAGVDRAALYAPHHAGPIAVAFAAAHPDRVSHLVLWCSYASGDEPQWMTGMGGLLKRDWLTYSEAIAHALLGWDRPDDARQYAAVVRAAVRQEDLARYWGAIRRFDARPHLRNVRAPTLVLHRRDIPLLPLDAARRLAAAIPGARLTIVGGVCPTVIVEPDEPLAAIRDFLSLDAPAPRDRRRG